MTLPSPILNATLLELELYFPISVTHPQIDFQLQASKDQPATDLSSHQGKKFMQIPIPQSAYEDDYMVINLLANNPIIPKDAGIGDDIRLLGIGMGSITFK